MPQRLADAPGALPARLALRSPVYSLAAIGSAPDRLAFDLAIPVPTAAPELLSLYAWDGRVWRFIPSRLLDRRLSGEAEFLPLALALIEVQATPPIIMVAQELSHDLNPDVVELASIISPAGLRPAANGGLVGSLAPGGNADSAYLYLPLIRNFSDPRVTDPATVERLLSHPGLRAEHIAQITNTAVFNGFHGVFIDYRDLSPRVSRRFQPLHH